MKKACLAASMLLAVLAFVRLACGDPDAGRYCSIMAMLLLISAKLETKETEHGTEKE